MRTYEMEALGVTDRELDRLRRSSDEDYEFREARLLEERLGYDFRWPEIRRFYDA